MATLRRGVARDIDAIAALAPPKPDADKKAAAKKRKGPPRATPAWAREQARERLAAEREAETARKKGTAEEEGISDFARACRVTRATSPTTAANSDGCFSRFAKDGPAAAREAAAAQRAARAGLDGIISSTAALGGHRRRGGGGGGGGAIEAALLHAGGGGGGGGGMGKAGLSNIGAEKVGVWAEAEKAMRALSNQEKEARGEDHRRTRSIYGGAASLGSASARADFRAAKKRADLAAARAKRTAGRAAGGGGTYKL